MKSLIIKKTGKKGQGLFAGKDFKKNELILRNDKSKLKKFILKQISKLSKEKQEHSDYIGDGKYVIDMSPDSYSNHSCDPNTVTKMKSILVSEIYALKDIKKGDELTHDYAYTSVDQFDQKNKKKEVFYWSMDCKCGAENCRKKVNGDFFQLPKKTQKKFYKYLPVSIRKKYKKRFEGLK